MKFEYVILPTHLPKSDPLLGLQNKIYELWHSVHGEVTQGAVVGDHFLRNDLATAILCNGQVVGTHFYTFMNTSSLAVQQTRYFQPISKESWQFLRAKNYHYLMTLEFLTVHPDFRKSKLGYSLGDVLISLGMKVMKSCGADASTAISRTDVKVDRSLDQMNFLTVQRDLNIFGYPCSFQIGPADVVTEALDLKVVEMSEALWRARADHSGRTQPAPARLRKIA